MLKSGDPWLDLFRRVTYLVSFHTAITGPRGSKYTWQSEELNWMTLSSQSMVLYFTLFFKLAAPSSCFKHSPAPKCKLYQLSSWPCLAPVSLIAHCHTLLHSFLSFIVSGALFGIYPYLKVCADFLFFMRPHNEPLGIRLLIEICEPYSAGQTTPKSLARCWLPWELSRHGLHAQLCTTLSPDLLPDGLMQSRSSEETGSS
jgi:hypothetical protein